MLTLPGFNLCTEILLNVEAVWDGSGWMYTELIKPQSRFSWTGALEHTRDYLHLRATSELL